VYKSKEEKNLKIFEKEKMNDPQHKLKSELIKNFKININDRKSSIKNIIGNQNGVKS